MKPDTPALITSALTVNEFIGAPVVGTENGVAKLKTDGAELIMTAVAGPVALSIKPSRARSDPSSVSEEKVESQRINGGTRRGETTCSEVDGFRDHCSVSA